MTVVLPPAAAAAVPVSIPVCMEQQDEHDNGRGGKLGERMVVVAAAAAAHVVHKAIYIRKQLS